MKNINRLIVITLSLFTFSICNVQSQSGNISLRDRIYFGGNLGLTFGSVTQIEISPYVGYRFTPAFSAGVGGTYNYYKTSRSFGSFNTSIYGGNIFTKYTLVRDFPTKGMSIFTHAEYEMLSLEKKYFEEPFTEGGRFLQHNFFIGGGLRQYLGGRASFEIIALYNINYHTYSPYDNPLVIRFGFNF